MSLPSSFLVFFLRTIQLNHSKKKTRDDNLDFISDTTYSLTLHTASFSFSTQLLLHTKSPSTPTPSLSLVPIMASTVEGKHEVLDEPSPSSTSIPFSSQKEFVTGEDQSSVTASEVATERPVQLYHKPPTKQFVLIMIAYVYYFTVCQIGSLFLKIFTMHNLTIPSFHLLHV